MPLVLLKTIGQRYTIRVILTGFLALMFSPVKVIPQGTDIAEPVIVKAQMKPWLPWEKFNVRTIQSLPGFTPDGIDSPYTDYGGKSGIRRAAKGFFYTEKIGDRWWFIDPTGSLYYNKAVVSVTYGKSKTPKEAAKRLYGTKPGWAAATTKLLLGNHFNSTGAWTDTAMTVPSSPRIPYTMLWSFMSSYGKRRGGTYQQPGHTGYPNDCIFVFDPGFELFCDEYAKKLISLKEDPYLLGHFSDNEMPFPEDAVDRYLSLDTNDAGYKAAKKWLMERNGDSPQRLEITPEDRETFLEFLADRYFSITSKAIRKYDPNHLFLGARFYGAILDRKPVFVSAGKHVDVISVNYYNTWTPDSAKMRNWVNWSGKPLIITEWYVKGADAGLANTSGAGWIVPTQKDRGLFYQHFALSLLQFKGCIGWHWFKYMDNDPQATGVDPSNNDSNKGIVSIEFEPYIPLLEKMKELNSQTYRLIDYFDGKGEK